MATFWSHGLVPWHILQLPCSLSETRSSGRGGGHNSEARVPRGGEHGSAPQTPARSLGPRLSRPLSSRPPERERGGQAAGRGAPWGSAERPEDPGRKGGRCLERTEERRVSQNSPSRGEASRRKPGVSVSAPPCGSVPSNDSASSSPVGMEERQGWPGSPLGSGQGAEERAPALKGASSGWASPLRGGTSCRKSSL